MRDRRKNPSYFEAYIQSEGERINRQVEKAGTCADEARSERINRNLLLYRVNMLIASFSYGEGKDKLTDQLELACETALGAGSLTYSDALVLASFSVMLDSCDGIKPVISRFDRLFAGDRLLHGISAYIVTGTPVWRGEYMFPKNYSDLDAVITSESKEAKERALLAHLQEWYANCEDSAWYETLDNPYNVYYGYWSFESAALARIFGLDNNILAQSEYYPVL